MALGRILLFVLAAMLLTVLDEDMAVVLFGVLAWLGLALAVRFRPSLADLARDRRLPRPDELAAVAVGLVGALLTGMLAELQWSLLNDLSRGRLPSAIEAARWALWTATMTAVLAPLWCEIRGGRRLGFASGGLIAAFPLFAGAGLMWESGLEPLLRDQMWSDARFGALIAAPASTFLIAAGGATAAEAFGGEISTARLLRRSAVVGMSVWALLIAVLVLDVANPGWRPGFTVMEGGLAGAVFAILIGLAWIKALWSVRRMKRIGGWGTAGVVAFLAFAMLISMAAPAGVTGAQWAELVAVILFPFAVLTAAIVAFAVAPLCGLAQWRPRYAQTRGAEVAPPV